MFLADKGPFSDPSVTSLTACPPPLSPACLPALPLDSLAFSPQRSFKNFFRWKSRKRVPMQERNEGAGLGRLQLEAIHKVRPGLVEGGQRLPFPLLLHLVGGSCCFPDSSLPPFPLGRFVSVPTWTATAGWRQGGSLASCGFIVSRHWPPPPATNFSASARPSLTPCSM